MPEPALPQLRSLALSLQGRPLHLRVLLPPNFATIAARNGTMPVKIEVCPGTMPMGGQPAPAAGGATGNPAATLPAVPLPPEKLPKGPWAVEPGVFLAALLIESWCDGRIPSMLQLDTAQLRQLLQPLEGTDSLFWLKAPQQPIRWQGGALAGVHECLQDKTTRAVATADTPPAPDQVPDQPLFEGIAPADGAAALPPMEPGLTPLEVDGSVNFLALHLPSRESALHPHALALVKDNGFQLEPSNGKWWLRDRHKTLQFLADQMHALRTAYCARFTENFTERTRNLRFARIGVDVSSTTPHGNDAFDLELYLQAPGLDEGTLQQALEKGQHYIEAATGAAGKRPTQAATAALRRSTAPPATNRNTHDTAEPVFILIPRPVRERAAVAQQALGAPAAQGLRSRFRSRIRKAEVAAAQTILDTLGAAPAAEPPPSDNLHRTTARQNDRGRSAQGVRQAGTTPQAARRGQPVSTNFATGEADEWHSPATRLPAQWLELSRALNDVDALPPCPVPPPLASSLRPYQRVGAAWLWHLYRSGLGGILADEMGLGKTVQCLAFLAAAAAQADDATITATTQPLPAHARVAPSSARTARPPSHLVSTARPQSHLARTASAPVPGSRATTQPSLVVCPAALVENWRREAAKFTPQLRVFCHHGDSRLGDAHEATHYDLILTSYGTLSRDQKLFESIAFRIAVADEAQHIKNAKTQNARAVRALQATGRFLLTGTPVENDIRELQSLFAFILPGYLNPPASGVRGSAAASTGEGRAGDRPWLIRRAAPYILRRMKRTVASDLPEKIEQILYCELGAPQRAFYREVQETARRAVQALELGGAAESRVRFAAFTELLRLRQTCIDPRLVDEQRSDIGSTKREALLELVQEAVEGGHRMLIFSQFTSALRLVAEDLEALGIRHFYLDGQTPNRPALCERFNTDTSVTAFLISLRAGGTGLNLTGADTVIHLDPWWNPAAQAQATDRAHRIGQQKIVTVYQLIAAQTVEEQVLTLQREKTALLEQLLDASDAASAKIGLDDLKGLIG